MISVQGLTKSFRDRLAISDISFSANRGEIVGLLGPNGAGKSTTMKILSGILQPSSGMASICGHDVVKASRLARANIGYLPENPPVYRAMEVEDYLHFAAALHGVEAAKRKAAVDSAMERCGLTEVRDRIIGNLSKGFRQRVGLAQAITHNPAVLILDEPTVGLDPKQIIDIRNLIGSFREEHTVLLSTHILSEVQATCHRVVVIDRGRMVAEDSVAGLTRRMNKNQEIRLETKQALNDAALSAVRGLSGVRSVEALARTPEATNFIYSVACEADADPRAALAKAVVQSGADLLELRIEQASLEDAFLRIISPEAHATGGAHA